MLELFVAGKVNVIEHVIVDIVLSNILNIVKGCLVFARVAEQKRALLEGQLA